MTFSAMSSHKVSREANNEPTPRGRILLEKLKVTQLTKFPSFYRSRIFITVFCYLPIRLGMEPE